MMNLLVLVQMALLGFLAVGGVLSVIYVVRNAGDRRGFGHTPMPDFESHFRTRLARQRTRRPY